MRYKAATGVELTGTVTRLDEKDAILGRAGARSGDDQRRIDQHGASPWAPPST